MDWSGFTTCTSKNQQAHRPVLPQEKAHLKHNPHERQRQSILQGSSTTSPCTCSAWTTVSPGLAEQATSPSIPEHPQPAGLAPHYPPGEAPKLAPASIASFSKLTSTNPANEDAVQLDQALPELYSVIQQQQRCSDNAEILACVPHAVCFPKLGVCTGSRLQTHLLATLKSNLRDQPLLLHSAKSSLVSYKIPSRAPSHSSLQRVMNCPQFSDNNKYVA